MNGQAVYGSRPWVVPSEGPTVEVEGSFIDAEERRFTAHDVRFTTQERYGNNRVYATLLDWPADGIARIEAFGSAAGRLDRPIHSVEVLGHDGEVEWHQGPDSLEVVLPEARPSSVGVVVRVTPEPAGDHPRLPFELAL